MTGSILDRVRTIFGDQGDDDPPRGAGKLFECRDCNKIFIREEPHPCPECGQPVEPIPNERDLGLG